MTLSSSPSASFCTSLLVLSYPEEAAPEPGWEIEQSVSPPRSFRIEKCVLSLARPVWYARLGGYLEPESCVRLALQHIASLVSPKLAGTTAGHAPPPMVPHDPGYLAQSHTIHSPHTHTDAQRRTVPCTCRTHVADGRVETVRLGWETCFCARSSTPIVTSHRGQGLKTTDLLEPRFWITSV